MNIRTMDGQRIEAEVEEEKDEEPNVQDEEAGPARPSGTIAGLQ